MRGWNTGDPRRAALANRLFWEPAHWVMQTKQFAELRRRAESTRLPEGDDGVPASGDRPVAAG